MSSTNLAYRVLELLVEQGVDDAVCDLALAALSSEADLADAIEGRSAERPEPEETDTVPAGAFLASLSVQGFRGIGSETRVTLHPGPGLTIISGRNGSGKSSLAEGLEYALTSTTYRWQQNTRFAERWRNLHAPEPCRVRVELAQEAVGRSTIAVEWPADALDEDSGKVTFQPHGKPRQAGLGDLGWSGALETYRPMLSYEELGGILRGRGSDLHDRIKRMLGLDALADADGRLKLLLDPLKQPMAAANRERQELRKRAAATKDDRAEQAATLLSKTSPDLTALRSLVTGAVDTSPAAATLQRIVGIELPAAGTVAAVAQRLQQALGEATGLADDGSALEEQRRQLLEGALVYARSVDGDLTCPVCEEGALDTDWRTRTQEVLAATDLLEEQRRSARTALDEARRQARRLASAPPPELTQASADLPSQSATREAWMRWSSVPANDAGLAAHLTTAYQPLVSLVAAWRAEAATAAADHEETWQPLALEIAAWVNTHEQARVDEDRRERLERAKRALQEVERQIRKERMTPIVDHARTIWSRLRQESNVDLGTIDLTGQATRRGVDITAVVDGEAAGALSVMSQGELHALALALFLPRAALAESPFQFVVLDDPVQAMDPSKVHGLAQVLDDLARTHQVVVLTHDDRLPQAGRRLPTPPRIMEVIRGERSQVVVQGSFDPASRHLDDARALCRDHGVPETTRRTILPNVLRHALEAACYERHYKTQLRDGIRIAEVEERWAEARTTREKLEVALGGQLLSEWRSRVPERGRAIRVCGGGGHGSLSGDLDEALADVSRAVRDIQSGAG